MSGPFAITYYSDCKQPTVSFLSANGGSKVASDVLTQEIIDTVKDYVYVSNYIEAPRPGSQSIFLRSDAPKEVVLAFTNALAKSIEATKREIVIYIMYGEPLNDEIRYALYPQGGMFAIHFCEKADVDLVNLIDATPMASSVKQVFITMEPSATARSPPIYASCPPSSPPSNPPDNPFALTYYSECKQPTFSERKSVSDVLTQEVIDAAGAYVYTSKYTTAPEPGSRMFLVRSDAPTEVMTAVNNALAKSIQATKRNIVIFMDYIEPVSDEARNTFWKQGGIFIMSFYDKTDVDLVNLVDSYDTSSAEMLSQFREMFFILELSATVQSPPIFTTCPTLPPDSTSSPGGNTSRPPMISSFAPTMTSFAPTSTSSPGGNTSRPPMISSFAPTMTSFAPT
jgi:hypothetical protein